MHKIINSSELLNELTPTLPENIIDGISDGCNYFFNPQGHYGPIILKGDALKVFNLCNGKNDLIKIKDRLYSEKINSQKIEKIITNLAVCELINLSPEIDGKIRIQNRKKKMFVWLQLTDSCNLKCNYCYIKKQETNLDYELSKKLINKIVNDCIKDGFNEIIFKLAGGEPMLRWEQAKSLIDCVNGMHDNKQNLTIKFHIITNCTILPKDLIAYIKEGKLGISISLDGVGKWHDIYRRYKNNDKGSFKNVNKNIEKLLSCGITPRVLSTITNANVFGLKELAKYCIDRCLGFRFSLYRETAKSENELKSDNELMIENLKSCYAYIKENLPKTSLYQCHKFGDVNLRSPRMRGCGMGVNNLIINSSGKICLCQYEMSTPIGDALENSVVKTMKEQQKYDIKNISINIIPVCKDCKWRYTCGGGCPFLTKRHFGTFLHYSPYCAVYKEILPILVELHAYQMLKISQEKI